RRVLITPDEVIKQSIAEATIDPRKLLSAIQIAEERFVRTALGYDLYELLAAAKNVEITSGNQATYQGHFNTTYENGGVTAAIGAFANSAELLSTAAKKLWNEHLWKYVAECVHFVAMPEV